MADDDRKFWNDAWAGHEDSNPEPDGLLISETDGLTPGRALDIGCGIGANAIRLAEQGWQVTAVDFSPVAIEKAQQLAQSLGVAVDFLVDDATSVQPEGQFDLICTFYIQLPPAQRAAMLSNAAGLLAPGGTLIFVSHDKSKPPPGWTEEDNLTLTTPFQIVAELPGLKIERASVMQNTKGGHAAQPEDEDDEEADAEVAPEPAARQTVDRHAARADSTVVRAVRAG